MKALMIAGIAVALVGPAAAQSSGNAPAPLTPHGPSSVLTPNQPGTAVIDPGSPNTVNSGPGANGTMARSGTGADNVTNNPGVAGNATNPSRAIPNEGPGGGGGGAGGGG